MTDWDKHYVAGSSGTSHGLLECPDCHALVWARYYGTNQENEPLKQAHAAWHLGLQDAVGPVTKVVPKLPTIDEYFNLPTPAVFDTTKRSFSKTDPAPADPESEVRAIAEWYGFNPDEVTEDFWEDVMCFLYHDKEAKNAEGAKIDGRKLYRKLEKWLESKGLIEKL